MGVSSSCGWGTIIDTVLAPSTQPDHNQVPIFSHQAERPSDQTVDADEVAHFELLSQRWWEPNGPMAALFKLNPTRIAYIRDQITAGNTPNSVGSRPFKGLTLLDVGCGGGLLSEPMARLGATVTGIDAAKLNIEVAAEHARRMALNVDYRCQSLEEVAASSAQYDIVLAMEVLEHVADRTAFIRMTSSCVTPGGALFFSTLNRTLKAFAVAIVGAEYILNWIPRGTHDWHKFTNPSLLVESLINNGIDTVDLTGVRYLPIRDRWLLTRDLSVNYMIHARKPIITTKD